ncbi:MAG: MFS transporter [Patescibacteria group bacterium]
MENQLETKSSGAFVIYILGFLFALHATLPIYINSSFLSLISPEKFVGIIYSIGSVATILAFFVIPPILRKFGGYQTAIAFILLELLSLISLAFLKSPSLLIFFFITSLVSIAIIGFIIDLFLENVSSDNKTGKIRGIFLTSVNIAWIVSPLITSFILTNGDYWKIYVAAAALLLPVLFIVKRNLKNFKDNNYDKTPLSKTINEIWKGKDIRNIFMISFLMQFFFAWMVIYTPLYLHNQIGFDWGQIGILFSVMLLPYVLTELPLGKIADDKLGEKEIMSIGFIIMAISTGVISFLPNGNFFLWMAILFITRIGASMVEIMSETYFFKKTNVSQMPIVSMFRTTKPLAYIIAPITATILFYFIEFKFIFIILGFLMFYGLRFSLALKDTR